MSEAGSNKPILRACGRTTRLEVLLLGVALVALSSACGDFTGGTASSANSAASLGAAPTGVSQAEQVQAFETTLWPLLRSVTCANCHVSSDPRTPFKIADPNSTTAYLAIVNNQKVDFGNPADSRLVGRLVSDGHNCWSNCASDGAEMLAAIQQWIQEIEARGGGTGGGLDVAHGTLTSNTLTLADGSEEEGGQRYEEGVIAQWLFKEGSGSVAADTSGVAPAMDLTIGTNVDWMSSYGLEFRLGKAMADRSTSRKLYDRIADPATGSGQYTIEAWIVPANTTQEGPSRIVSYSNGGGSRNFMMGQVGYQYAYRNRSVNTEISGNGTPTLITYDVDQDLQAALQHAVMTFDIINGRRIFVNGVFTDDFDEQGGGLLWNWDPTHRFVLGSETNDQNQWQGQIRMVSIYDRALRPEQIMENYLAGVGKRLKLSFDVSQWVGPGSTIDFAVTQIDDASYLFCQPTINTDTPGIRVHGMRVQVNGTTPSAGQGFSNMNTLVTTSRQQLSGGCSIIANPSGEPDQFSLSFEGLGNFVDPATPVDWGTLTYDYTGVEPLPTNGARDFSRINESMASITGVSPAVVETTYDEIRQQLPGTYDLRSFVTSNQVGIAKLALEYCDAMVQDPTLRDAFFDTVPAFEFDATTDVAFQDNSGSGGDDKRLRITGPLVQKIIGPGYSTQPDGAMVEGQLLTLIENLKADCPACDATHTKDIVSGACTAALSSAAMTLH